MKLNVKRHAVVQPQDQSIKLIPLTRGQNAIVDASDYHCLSQWNWKLCQNGKERRNYAGRWEAGRLILMHRQIIGGNHEVIDHQNADGLDNRRCNLRGCTNAENQWKAKLFATNTSGIRGVSWNKSKKKWVACIGVNSVIHWLGYFRSSEEARIAYLDAARQLRCEKRVDRTIP